MKTESERRKYNLPCTESVPEANWNPNLSIYDKYVYSMIRELSSDKNGCSYGNEKLCEICGGMSLTKLKECLANLEENGYIILKFKKIDRGENSLRRTIFNNEEYFYIFLQDVGPLLAEVYLSHEHELSKKILKEKQVLIKEKFLIASSKIKDLLSKDENNLSCNFKYSKRRNK